VPCHGIFIKLVGCPLDNRDGVLRALAEACPQPVTEVIGGKYRLAVNDLYGPFRAGWDAETAAVASLPIYLDNLSNHVYTPVK
jgi:hypothetical protein